MKKMILAPLCSAFVIPGLGQIVNQHLKKGVFILLSVLALFVIGVVKLVFVINATLSEVDLNHLDAQSIIQKLQVQHFTLIWGLVVAFGLLWLYSVVDAFLGGREMDRLEEENHR
jgi:hypothetical protein